MRTVPTTTIASLSSRKVFTFVFHPQVSVFWDMVVTYLVFGTDKYENNTHDTRYIRLDAPRRFGSLWRHSANTNYRILALAASIVACGSV